MPRTQSCQQCHASGVYFKTLPNGKSLLWDTNTNNWHHRSCPAISDFRRSEFEKIAIEAAEAPKQPAQSGNGHSGLSEADVNRLIAENRPSLVSAAVREAQDMARGLVADVARTAVDRNRHESDYANLAHRDQELTAKLETLLTENSSLREQIEQIAATVAANQASKREIEVKLPDDKRINVGRQHKEFPRLVRYLGLGLLVFMAGPAGSGKTEACKAAAKALDIDFYEQPLNPMLSESKLTGFMSANGAYVTTTMRKAFEFGGLLLLDEGDNANAAILAGMNSLLANDSYGFPDGRIMRHPNFRCVLTANTWGHGADREYVARNQLDAATLNRFVKLPWDYDEDFELAIAGNVEWTRYVQKVREVVFRNHDRIVVSPRQSIFGSILLAAGEPREQVEESVLWADVPKDVKNRILASI